MRWLEHLEEGLIAFLMAAMTVVTFMQVVARYVFNYSFVWALELTGVMFAWLIFVGMSYGVRVGAHIGVDALVKSLGRRREAGGRDRRRAGCASSTRRSSRSAATSTCARCTTWAS